MGEDEHLQWVRPSGCPPIIGDDEQAPQHFLYMHSTPDWNMNRSTNIINIHKYADLSFGKYTSKWGPRLPHRITGRGSLIDSMCRLGYFVQKLKGW